MSKFSPWLIVVLVAILALLIYFSKPDYDIRIKVRGRDVEIHNARTGKLRKLQSRSAERFLQLLEVVGDDNDAK